ncbi:MAG: hypothetical protein AAGD14_00080 [Planctomycetota bacterium]
MRILLLGVSAPFLTRAVQGEFGRWMEDWGRWMSSRPRDFVVGWLWFLAPFAVLAIAERFAKSRPARASLWTAVVATFAIALWSSVPVAGHGYRFYLGEAFFPILAAGAMPLAALIGYATGWCMDRRASDRPA